MKNPAKYALYLLGVGIMVFCLLFIASCSKDDDKPLVDIKNPNAVAKSLTVENATYVAGNPPSPTASASAPKLNEYNDGSSLLTIQGSKIIVSTYLDAGSAAGFYVKIDGSDGYYKIASTQATGRLATKTKPKHLFSNGRIKSEDSPSFSLKVPDNIQPGEFCISYCVYDVDNNVSNIIQQCVTVNELGGDNASFLTANEWQYLKYEGYENNILVDKDSITVDDVYEYETTISCQESTVNITVQEKDRTDYEYVTFATNGAFGIEAKSYYKYLDYENSNCTATYLEDTEEYNFTGAWSYNDDTKTLVFIYNENEDSDQYETVAEQYAASVDGNFLILKFTYEEGTYDIVTLAKK